MTGTEITREINALREVTTILSRKWTPIVLYTIDQRSQRSYTEINNSIDGISDKMLSSSLDTLRDLDLITKSQQDGRGVIYHTTPDGETFCNVLDAAIGWQLQQTQEETRVLVVEDDPMAADLLVEYLEGSYHVTHSPSGHDAVESLSSATDIVVLDRQLDGITGSEVASRIKSEADPCLILVVSAVRPGEQLADLPVDDYVQKPVEEDELIRRLEALQTRLHLGALEREYLAVESRRQDLRAEHGQQAASMEAHNDLIDQSNRIDLPEERKETLDGLIYQS